MKYILAFSLLLSVVPVYAGSSPREFLKLMEAQRNNRNYSKRNIAVEAKTRKNNKRKADKQTDCEAIVASICMFTSMVVVGVGGHLYYYFNPEA